MTTLNEHETNFDNNPTKFILKSILWLISIFVIISIIGYGFGWFSDASKVVKKEFSASASLKKYEWFKDASQAISEKKQTIDVYQGNVDLMLKDYKDIKRTDWDRLDKQQYNQWLMEIVGLKASYNKVVKEYNSQSSKFNWGVYNTEENNIPPSFNLYITK